MRLFRRRGETASSLDLLVVGLGNPGREYAGNRHNVGRMVVDELARRHGGAFKGKFSGHLAEIRLDGHKVALLKPETYMNESGRSVGAAARYFKLEPDAILVVHDESDLELGRLQARVGGGPDEATRARWPTTSSRTSSLRTTPRRSSPAPPMLSHRSTPRVSSEPSSASTRRAWRNVARRRGGLVVPRQGRRECR
jgi:hypothetical protein